MAIGLSWASDLAAHGVAVVGPIPGGLPSFEIPSPGFADAAYALQLPTPFDRPVMITDGMATA